MVGKYSNDRDTRWNGGGGGPTDLQSHGPIDPSTRRPMDTRTRAIGYACRNCCRCDVMQVGYATSSTRVDLKGNSAEWNLVMKRAAALLTPPGSLKASRRPSPAILANLAESPDVLTCIVMCTRPCDTIIDIWNIEARIPQHLYESQRISNNLSEFRRILLPSPSHSSLGIAVQQRRRSWARHKGKARQKPNKNKDGIANDMER